jgi:DNA-binding XRE family transcriptional regulator
MSRHTISASDWRTPLVALTQEVRLAIRRARLCYGYTYAELARYLEVSKQSTSYWEKGTYKSVSYFTWLKICSILKLDATMIPRPCCLSDEDVSEMRKALPANRHERLGGLMQAISSIDHSTQVGIINKEDALSLKEQIVDEYLVDILPSE